MQGSAPTTTEFSRKIAKDLAANLPAGRGTNPELRNGRRRDAMVTNAGTTADSLRRPIAATTAQKVVIVNGSAEILEVLETVLDAGHYDVVFVESSEHAYSQIKRVQPNLVILCVRIDDADGFQVLSMLKLDDDTRSIPVLTYTTEYDGPETTEETAEPSESEMFAASKAAAWMN
jgi:PleD family two-component response regulator